MPQIERFMSGERLLAQVIRSADMPSATEFITPPEANLQVGFIVKPVGVDVPRHKHHPIAREIRGTAEVLVVREGSGAIDIYDDDGRTVGSTAISSGDVVVLLDGGHGIRVTEDLVLLEIKQGPYPGRDEKELF